MSLKPEPEAVEPESSEVEKRLDTGSNGRV